jgi:hypothetical protein
LLESSDLTPDVFLRHTPVTAPAMASLNMTPEELKQLDLLRNRFSQLTNSLTSLQGTAMTSNPLPSR